MRFTLPMLLILTLLTWHQALALPSVSPFTPNMNLPRAAPYDAATHQMLDLMVVGVAATADLDTRSLRARAVAWKSAELKRRLVVGLSAAVATSIHLANAALTWKLSLVYAVDSRGRQTVTPHIYPDENANVNVCVNKFTTSTFGNTGNTYWVDAEVDLEGTYTDAASGNIITMFWTASMRLGQLVASCYIHDMENPPTGYEKIIPQPNSQNSQMCLIPGGTSVKPTSWTFDSWA